MRKNVTILSKLRLWSRSNKVGSIVVKHCFFQTKWVDKRHRPDGLQQLPLLRFDSSRPQPVSLHQPGSTTGLRVRRVLLDSHPCVLLHHLLRTNERTNKRTNDLNHLHPSLPLLDQLRVRLDHLLQTLFPMRLLL